MEYINTCRCMLPKYTVLFVLMMACHFGWAQQVDFSRQIAQIDSLMVKYYRNFERAHRETDSLYELLSNRYTAKSYKGFKVDVMLQKAILYALNGEHNKGLEIALEAFEEAVIFGSPEKQFRSCWIIAIMYERAEDFVLCRKYLDNAYEIYRQDELHDMYSTYCIRMASYYSHIHMPDSAIYYAYRGLRNAEKCGNSRDVRDAYLLLGSFLAQDDYTQAVKYKSLAAGLFLEIEDFTSAASQFTDTAAVLFKHNRVEDAFRYSDTAMFVLNGSGAYINPGIYELRGMLFETVGNIDSAYYYFRKFHEVYASEQHKLEKIRIKQISEQFQNDKKEAVIRNKNQQMLLIVSLLVVIMIAVMVLIRKNREIGRKNNIINTQLGELSKILEQKQVLLSELQHRVKNNLQHIISILEIQKESVDFNNIDELIRGNQNRIHSMALLHKKLHVADNVNDVDLPVYIGELAELVKDSYETHSKKVQLVLECHIPALSVEKALPLGLIVVELVSNSMKHAFKSKHIGFISIALSLDTATQKWKLYYADNGEGFDFEGTETKGLGLEIIKGLIDQLDGTVIFDQDGGFSLVVLF